MKNFIENIKKYPVILFFGFLLFAISIADLFSPIESFSDLENRELSVFPKFNLSSLVKNEYTPKIEDFTEDHFIKRNYWISLKSVSESVLGKLENNSVIYGKNGKMFTKYLKTDVKNQNKNIAAINTFIARHKDKKITFILAPTAGSLSSLDKYDGSPILNSTEIIENAKKQIDSKYFFDVTDTLAKHSEKEYLYYRTDHHWTTLGAYYAYDAYMTHIGKTATKQNDLKFVEVENFLGTHYSKAKSYNVKPDTLSYLESDSTIDISGKTDSIYDLSKLDTRDKYAMFLRGNSPFSTVNGTGDGKILVIKDSYANCFVPFLTENFEQIDVLDMRYYSQKVDTLIDENKYDEILFLYNCETFDSDIHLPKIN